MSKKSKRRAQRRYCNKNRARAEPNVKPSPLAERKKRPWLMMTLFNRGDVEGITPEQFEAGIQIAEAHYALVRTLGYRALSLTDVRQLGAVQYAMTDGQARWAAIYVGWSIELKRRGGDPSHVVDWINDEARFDESDRSTLVRALDLWANHRDEWEPEPLTSKRRGSLHSRYTMPLSASDAAADAASSLHHRAPTPTTAPRAVAQAARATRPRTPGTPGC
jgi:hypothetical protein